MLIGESEDSRGGIRGSFDCASSGEVKAVRTTSWRIFDLLWALHIMDYQDRDDFNHWLLTGMAILGLFTVFSGLILFLVTQIRKFRPD